MVGTPDITYEVSKQRISNGVVGFADWNYSASATDSKLRLNPKGSGFVNQYDLESLARAMYEAHPKANVGFTHVSRGGHTIDGGVQVKQIEPLTEQEFGTFLHAYAAQSLPK